MKHVMVIAALVTVSSVQVVRADVAPSQEAVQSAVQGDQVVTSRARKYQGSRAGSR
ncbi:MAG: hypothetical protein AB3N23_03700 [Paracoccaceae bacterium]